MPPGSAPEQPGPAPELAAAMRETRAYRDLLAEVLRTFGEPAAWPMRRVSRVTRMKYRKWLERAGMKEGQ